MSLSAQPKSIQREIDEIKKTKSTLYISVTEKTIEEARSKAKKMLIDKVLGNFRIIDDIPTLGSVEDESMQGSNLRQMIRNMPLNSKELTWGKKGKDETIFLYILDYDAKEYAVKRATIKYRNPNEYSFADGYATLEKDALGYARGNLITQFSAKVSSETNLTKKERTVDVTQAGVSVSRTTDLTKTENEKGYKEDYKSNTQLKEFEDKLKANVYQEELEIKNRVFSQMSLQGLKTITINLWDEYYAFAYISNEDKIKSFDVIKSKITASAVEADRAFKSGNVLTGLKGFYKTYILSDTYFGNVEHTFEDGTKTENLQENMRSRIDALLKDEVEVITRPAYMIDERDVVAPFQLVYKERPLDGLRYAFKFQSFNFNEILKNGRGRLNLPGYLPEYKSESFQISFFIDISDDIKSDPTIKELEPLKRLEITKNIKIDFTNVFRFGVEAGFTGKRVEFEINKIDNKLIREVRWVLGDGEERYTTDTKLIYTYEELGEYTVTVEINGVPSLSVNRFLDLSTKRIKAKEPLRSVVAEASVPVVAPIAEEKGVSAIESITVQKNNPEKIEIKLNTYYKEISDIKTTRGLLTYLKARKDRNELTFGKQADILDSEGSLILVADQEKVHEQLIFSQNRFYLIESGEEIPSLVEKFSGKYLIWVKRN